ncbi:MAG: PorT family protein [Saprospiraceae bacterium]|nr:PorT family protein [Saprospiraceae bacterium]MCB9356884.1 PorT family protein [Lewinellaceae bacterium]
MKKLLASFFTAALLVSFVSTTSAQVRFGVKAGLNLANMSYSNFGELEPETSMLPTFMVGGQAEFDFSENLGLGVGLQLNGKGAKTTTEFLSETFETKSNPMYLQVPIMLQYRNMGFFAAVGPYVGFGLFGKAKTDGAEDEDLSFGNSEDDDLAPLDYGAGVEVGYEFGSLRATASYNLGLANAIPKDVREGTDFKATHGVIGIALAYLFGGE